MKDLIDKAEFRGKKNKNKGERTVLKTQSTKDYKLIRIQNSYYIKRVKDNETILLGDKDKAENYILDGLHTMRVEVKQLFKS